ncbi:tRNA pseudouridine(55) synthase TruB [Microbacterium sp. P01]|uniref:tRNA pseudouridine(55) synthase TruB n=1 Tax=Microbacterium sp. P01 TaxID=3366261 RepID=UPI00366C97D2
MADDSAPSGILLVDKPGGMTSHDVVSRARKALGTRKIGHAGTLDPMATGLLVLGVGPATRLLTFIVGLDKTYEATIRLGSTTDTDDADGAVTSRADAAALALVDAPAIAEAMAPLAGDISQVPSTVSAIKVDGRRAYDLAREGAEVSLTARDVSVSRFDLLARRDLSDGFDLDVVVDCSSGTYVRALARDLGRSLGVGGHLTALRRTRIGPFPVQGAASIDQLADAALQTAADVGALLLGRFDATQAEALDLRQGKRLVGAADRMAGKRAAAIDPDGMMIGVVHRRGSDVKSEMNLPTGKYV